MFHKSLRQHYLDQIAGIISAQPNRAGDVPPSLPLAAAKLRTFLLSAHSIAIFSFSSAHNSLIPHISESESPLPGNAFSLEEYMQQTSEKQTHEHQAKHFIAPQKQKMLQKY